MITCFFFSCRNENRKGSVNEETVIEDRFTTYDLNLFEVRGHVKQIRYISYLDGNDIKKQGKDYHSVKPLSEYYPIKENFDKEGKWTSAPENDVRRDTESRVVFHWDPEGNMEYEWKDSLVVCYIDDHHSRYNYEYDIDGKKTIETYYFKDPNKNNSSFVKYAQTNYHYTNWDSRGNWTERWCETYYEGNKSPKIHVELREIDYYK